MKINIKLSDGAKAPTKGSDGAAAYDLYALGIIDYEVTNALMTVDTGVALAIPKGYVGIVSERSSTHKQGLDLVNKIGVIDSDYRGTIKLKFRLNGKYVNKSVEGVRFAQLLIIKAEEVDFIEVDKLDNTARAESGFGSSGE